MGHGSERAPDGLVCLLGHSSIASACCSTSFRAAHSLIAYQAALKGLIALPCGRGESVVFRIGRTLNPITLPPLRLPPPSPTAEELRAEAAFWRVFNARVGRALSQVGWHAEACC